MKKSIRYLPKHKQETLKWIVNDIRAQFDHCEMVILFGSYARNTYIDYDERVEFGVPTSYTSDFDILVVTSKINERAMFGPARRVKENYNNTYGWSDRRPHLQIIYENIEELNRQLSDGRYFYTQIKAEGVILYNRGNYKLARRRKLNFDEIVQQAEEYYNERFISANEFLEGVIFYFDKGSYKKASFMLHQAVENYFHAIRLVYTLRDPKLHNLEELIDITRGYSPELWQVFPRDTEEEDRLFKLLKAAYIESRYNTRFVVAKEDIETLLPKVEQLRDITGRICQQQIEAYKTKLTRPVEENI